MTRRGITLIEVLIVIAVLIIVAAITVPVYSKAKMSGKFSAAITNLKQVHAAYMLYREDYGGATDAYGSAAVMRFPHIMDVWWESALEPYGFSDDMKNSICPRIDPGLPTSPSGYITFGPSNTGLWPDRVQLYRERHYIAFDENCNTSGVNLANPYTSKRSIAVLLNGSVRNVWNTGDPIHPEFYSSLSEVSEY